MGGGGGGRKRKRGKRWHTGKEHYFKIDFWLENCSEQNYLFVETQLKQQFKVSKEYFFKHLNKAFSHIQHLGRCFGFLWHSRVFLSFYIARGRKNDMFVLNGRTKMVAITLGFRFRLFRVFRRRRRFFWSSTSKSFQWKKQSLVFCFALSSWSIGWNELRNVHRDRTAAIPALIR